VPAEPVGGEGRDLVERARLGEQVTRARNDRKIAFAGQVTEYRLVEL
jgi:hypothetical protein